MRLTQLALVLALAATAPAFACPQNCKCDSKGNVIYNYNTTNVNNSKTDNSVRSASSSAASATGGSASATGGSATIAKGAVENTVTATGGTGGVASAVVAAGAVQTSQGQTQSQSQSTENSGNNTGNSSTNVSYSNSVPRAPVATAYSASLTSGMDTCLGSASGGLQTIPLGLTFGSTKVDKNCVLIKQTSLLRETGHDKAACLRMQMGKEGELIKQAMKDAGETCDPIVVTGPAPADTVTHEELDRAFKKAVSK